MADAYNIAKRLRANQDRQKQTAISLNESLAVVDAIIDEYDELIIKLDEKVPFLKSMLATLWDQHHQLKTDLEDLEYEFEEEN